MKLTAAPSPEPESESNISIAEECNARATEINGLRGDWEPRNGTTVVMKAVDNQTVPKSLQGVLNDNEIYIGGNG